MKEGRQTYQIIHREKNFQGKRLWWKKGTRWIIENEMYLHFWKISYKRKCINIASFRWETATLHHLRVLCQVKRLTVYMQYEIPCYIFWNFGIRNKGQVAQLLEKFWSLYDSLLPSRVTWPVFEHPVHIFRQNWSFRSKSPTYCAFIYLKFRTNFKWIKICI